jgi:hypothetical protein
VLWGAYHALLFVPLLVMNKNRRYRDTVATITLADGTVKTKWLPSIKEAGQMLLTFALAVVGWIIFRVESIGQLGEILNDIFNVSLLDVPYLINRCYYIPLFISVFVMIFIEWISRNKNYVLEDIEAIMIFKNRWVRVLSYSLILLIMLYCRGDIVEFIYFQF